MGGMGRLDIEAAAAYAFPPVTGVALLVLEHNNSYVRFHAWQSAMTFTALIVCAPHPIFYSDLDFPYHYFVLGVPVMDAIHRRSRCHWIPGVTRIRADRMCLLW